MNELRMSTRTPSRSSARPQRRRGFVIIMVLVVVGCAILIATGLLFTLQADAAGSTSTRQATRSRAMAWSGVQAVMRQLHEQRDVILDGLTPEIDATVELYEANTRLGVVRLLPFADGRLIIPEGGRLDVNHVTAEALERTGMIDPTLAQSIIAARTRRGSFQCLTDLLQIEGITPEVLYGSLEDIRPMDDARGDGWLMDEASGDDGLAVGLVDVLTVYGFEPLLQRDGRLRINLNMPWSDELGARVDERFGQGVGEVVRQLMENGTVFDSENALFGILNLFEVDPNEWIDPCDALSMTDASIVGGRLDINTAPYEALLGLPGIEPETADEIIRRRDELPIEMRASVAWPAIEEIIEPSLYTTIGNLITTRSWCYRVRLAAGEVSIDDPEGPLEEPMILEAVIDLADPSPRVAYLRDITMLQMSATLALAASDAWIDDAAAVPATSDDLMTLDDLSMDPMEPLPGDDIEGPMFDDGLGDPDEAFEDNMGDPGDPEEAAGGGNETPSSAENDKRTDPRIGRWRSGG